jgi:hypothetical protein
MDERRTFLDDFAQAYSLADDRHFDERMLRHDRFRASWTPAWLNFRFIATAAAAVCLLGAILYWQSESHLVSATELLNRAVLAQDHERNTSGRVVYLKSRSLSCLAGRSSYLRTVSGKSSECQKLAESLASVNWDSEHPLSARAYRNWRQNLHRKQDSVRSDATSLVLTTTTAEGAVDEASLSVRPSDFEPLAVTLHFEELGSVEIREESETPRMPALTAATRQPVPERTPDPAGDISRLPEIDPLDLAETEAWLTLHRLDADGGFEATVLRSTSSVEVRGVVKDSERRQELTSNLHAIPHLAISLRTYEEAQPSDYDVFPRRDVGGLSEPLAKDWLKQTFPDAASSNAFQRQALATSKSIYGCAWTLSLVEAASLRLPAVLRARLDKVLAAQRTHLKGYLEALAGQVSPLIGPVEVTDIVTVEQAASLDAALTWLIFGSPPGAVSTEEQLERLRSALSR